MSEKFWHLKHTDLFERLAPAEMAQIEARSRIRKFERHSLIYAPTDQGDSVLLLAAGRVKLYHLTGEGKQALLGFIDPGELFGELALLDDGEREEFAEAMAPSSVLLIPRAEVRALMERHPEVSLGVSKLIGFRRRRVERRLKSLLFRSNRERLVHLLLELAEKYGRRSPEGVVLGVKLSHQELAAIIGSTRETVTILLGELQAEGAIAIARRRITVLNLGQLAASIDAKPPRLPEPEIPAPPVLIPQTELGT
jgi:CRP-like cAMP-binding protein